MENREKDISSIWFFTLGLWYLILNYDSDTGLQIRRTEWDNRFIGIDFEIMKSPK